MTKKEIQRLEAVKILRGWGLKNGTEVYATVKSVSRSGMYRRVQLFIVGCSASKDSKYAEGRIIDISYWAAKVMEWPYNENGIGVRGCGMDMLFHTVDNLSYSMGYGDLAQRSEDKTGLRYSRV